VVLLPLYTTSCGVFRIVKLRQDGVWLLSLPGDAPGDPDDFHKRDPAGPVIDEEYPSLDLIGVRDRSLGEDGEGVRDPVDDDYVVGGLLLNPLGHGKQTGLIQDTPPIDGLCILVTF
jgi:hypothetical protein